MKRLHIETPLIEFQPLGTQLNKPIWLKLEALQPTGSFKIRGIGFASVEYARRGAKRFISSSAGNAGVAVAYAGRQLSIPVVVVVPETATKRTKTLIEQHGAEVIVFGSTWQEANLFALSMLKKTDAFLHPHDDPLLWQGHSTIIDEVAGAGVKPDIIVLSVGGGGLLCGVIEGLFNNNWTDIPVLAVETNGADSFAQSVKAGYRVELPSITSLATSLGVRQVCDRAFTLSKQHLIYNVVVSDREAVLACEKFISDHRIVVEPACGASLATIYGHAKELELFKSILIIVCGGVTTTIEQLRGWSLDLEFANA